MTAQPPSRIVTARKPRPLRHKKPKPIKTVVYSPSAKSLAAMKRWGWMTGREK
jgi:hypothetical protein